MTEPADRPSLLKLPPVLLRLIIPDPKELHNVSVDDLYAWRQEWLAIKHNWREVAYQHELGYYRTAGPHYTLQTLRALSHTCRSLRAFVLHAPLECGSREDSQRMGRLRDALREAPYLVPHIRQFAFWWDMNGDYDRCDAYPEEHGTLLDMAFIDRGALWAQTLKASGAEIEHILPESARPLAVFSHDGHYFLAPGHAPPPLDLKIDDHEYESPRHGLLSREDTNRLEAAEKARRQQQAASIRYRWMNPYASGPDGNGQDRRIRNVEDYEAWLGEVVARMTFLEVFAWRCGVGPMPRSLCEALQQAKTLTSLHLDLTSRRNWLHVAPYWEFGAGLQELSINFTYCTDCNGIARRELVKTEELSEEDLTSFELPSAPLDARSTLEEAQDLHTAVVFRIIIAAAKGGRLKRLRLPEQVFQKPFAIRTLLPFWVGVEKWRFMMRYPKPMKQWHEAASTLRCALAHASLWLPEAVPGSRNNRRLTRDDVRGLRAYFVKNPVSDFALNMFKEPGLAELHAVVELSLPWLKEDANLAQQVADAWNTVVERGEADVVKCACTQCRARARGV